jgi:CubicO group peptidase (beta-lactamase class C family)
MKIDSRLVSKRGVPSIASVNTDGRVRLSSVPGYVAVGGYGHSWFVDPEREFTVIALTNTALEGLAGRFPIELRDAIYRVL